MNMKEEIERIDGITRVTDGRRDLVHAAFFYQCQVCKHTELIYMGYGVEGPPDLRASGLYIPSPFAMRCACGEYSSHVAFGSDRHFAPRAPLQGTRYFRVPDVGPDPQMYNSSMFSGELKVVPWEKT